MYFLQINKVYLSKDSKTIFFLKIYSKFSDIYFLKARYVGIKCKLVNGDKNSVNE